jgi:hypothetical protein
MWREVTEIDNCIFTFPRKDLKKVKLSALRADRALLPRNIFWYSFLLQGESTPKAIVQLEGLGQLKKCNDLIGTRTRDLSACNIAPRTTMLLCPPYGKDILHLKFRKIIFKLFLFPKLPLLKQAYRHFILLLCKHIIL